MILYSTNFREIAVGNISPGTLYRNSHPVLWNGEQVQDIILSANRAGIKTVINLSDSKWTLEWKVADCSWYKQMFESGNVIAVNMTVFDILDREFHTQLKKALLFMTRHEPPYLVHCEAGIDRTGFLSIILEAFMGPSLEDIVKDYMISFVDSGKYSPDDYKNGLDFVRDTFSRIEREPVQAKDDLQVLAAKYLTEQVGLGKDELVVLEERLSDTIII
jgi:protein tyrosine/serine phosphatase